MTERKRFRITVHCLFIILWKSHYDLALIHVLKQAYCTFLWFNYTILSAVSKCDVYKVYFSLLPKVSVGSCFGFRPVPFYGFLQSFFKTSLCGKSKFARRACGIKAPS